MKKEISWKYIIPIIIPLSLVPLVVFLKIIPLEGILLENWIGEKNYDFFSFYKAVIISISSLVGLLIYLWDIYKGNLKFEKNKYYIPLGIYTIFIILSTIFAEHTQVALYGFPDRYEGMIVQISYIVLLFLVINVVKTKEEIKVILFSLLISSFLICTIGIFQFLGMDIFKTNFFRNLLNISEGFTFLFGSKTIYSTLYNSNYVGSYIALVLPPTFLGYLYVKKNKFGIALGILSTLMFATLLGSYSRAGMIGLGTGFLVMAVILNKKLLKHFSKLITISLVYLLTFFLMNIGSEGILLDQVKSINPFYNKTSSLEKLYISEKNIFLHNGNEPLSIEIDNEGVYFYDEVGGKLLLDYNVNDNVIKLDDGRYSEYIFKIDDYKLKLNFNRESLLFINTEDEVFFADGDRLVSGLILGDSKPSFSNLTQGLLKNIKIDENTISIEYEGVFFEIVFKENEIFFTNEEGKELTAFIDENGLIFFEESEYADFKLKFEENILSLELKHREMDFLITDKGFVYMTSFGNYSQDFLLGNNIIINNFDKTEEYFYGGKLKDIVLDKDSIEIFREHISLKIIYQDGALLYKDKNDEKLFKGKDFKYVDFNIHFDNNILQINFDKFKLYFVLENNEFKFLDHYGNLINFEGVDYWGFEGIEQLGSSRGYIWSRSLPLLRNTIFLGYGPDTYPIYFPQHDIVGKMIGLNTYAIVVDKPHNMYLQMGINTGVVSLVSFLGLSLMYFIDSVFVYVKKRDFDFVHACGFGLFIAVCGYMVASMFNDSVVSVAPIFWVLLGLGIVANRILREVK